MTTLNIPSSPSQGDTYEANGVVYTWDGSKWKADSSYVSNLNGGPLAGFRNQLINGDFRVWQRGGSFPASPGAKHTADRWRTGANRGVTRVAFNNKFGAECTNDGKGSVPILGQPIEIEVSGRPGPFVEGQQYTFSCVVKNSSTADIALEIQHRISSDINTGAQTVVPFTVIESGVSSTQTVSFTFEYTSAMRPTSDKTCTYLEIRSSDATGTMTITDVQLEPGPVATPFEHRPIGTERQLCARYFRSYPLGVSSYSGMLQHYPLNMSSTSPVSNWQCSLGINAEMRIDAPTVILGGGNTSVTGRNIIGSGIATASSLVCVSVIKGLFYFTSTSAASSGSITQLRGTSSSGTLNLDAEL